METVKLNRKNITYLTVQEEIDAHQKKVADFEAEILNKRLFGESPSIFNPILSRILVVGCGGTGSWLMPKLAKTINDMKRKRLLAADFKLMLVDGDTVESKNLIRQNFVESDIGQNKAEVMALRYGATMPDIELQYIDKYVSMDPKFDPAHFVGAGTLAEFTAGGTYKTIVFNLVDNQNARRAVHSLPMDGWVVDIGNELVHGQLFASPYGTAAEPEFQRLNFFTMSPETLTTEEEVKVYSCAEADEDVQLEEQFLVANDTAALVGHNWLCSLMSAPDSVPARINFTCLPMPQVEVVLKNIPA
jgi:hypothetical protein